LVVGYPLFLCLTFHRARLFLLPTLRLRLGFAIYFSEKGPKIFIPKYFEAL
jgi:hypothetical protein